MKFFINLTVKVDFIYFVLKRNSRIFNFCKQKQTSAFYSLRTSNIIWIFFSHILAK